MKMIPKKLPVIILFCFLPLILFAQPSERYFDTIPPSSDETRLTVLFPSTGTIRCLMELRNQGFIALKKLMVVGVYHQKELTDYTKSIAFIQEKNLEWFKFHRISTEINRDTLFQASTLTPEFENIFKKSDGIIFFGGEDIPPSLYHQKTNLLTDIRTPYRHFLELSLAFHLLGGFQDENFEAFLESRPQFPVLGLCLGCQSLNVGTGGTLIQDILTEVYQIKYIEDWIDLPQENWHDNPFAHLFPEKVLRQNLSSINMHPIKLLENSKFVREFGFKTKDVPLVRSTHHQMVDRLGKGMKIAATSLDGKVVEAIEHQRYPNVLGVQFHPESPCLWDKTLKLRMRPDDKEEISLLSILKKNPPSYSFHKKIWKWFSENLD
jgi:putative glutamine amidotransferase